MTDSNITLWRSEDPADGTWQLGRVFAEEDGVPSGRAAIATLTEGDVQALHAFTGDILNLHGHDQDAIAYSDEIGGDEAEPPTEEERLNSNIWQALALTQRIESLQAARREVRLGVIETELGKPTDDEINAHPLVVRINAEIAEARAQMAILI